MVDVVLGLEERCSMLERQLRESRDEALYYKRISEETGKRRLRGIDELSRLIALQRSAEEEKARLEAKLREAQKMEAIATLAGGIAHEFNNALFAVLGSIELLQMDLPENNSVIKYTETMKKSTHRMANLTDKLLAYAQGGKYQPKIISLSDYIEDTLPFLRPMISSSVRIETDMPRDLPDIMVDLTQMQLVLSAVITNASEAIEEQGRIRIRVKEEEIDEEYVNGHPDARAGHFVCLVIEDDGRGMDQDTKERIFEPFFTTKFQGRGLGLAAVYGIIRSHDGWISVDSVPEKGTELRIYLPVVESQPEKVEFLEPEVVLSPGTILVIEDEDFVMDIARQMLDKLGYRVLEARTGREAIDMVYGSNGEISAVMLDLGLPDMEGNSVFSTIKKEHPDLKVIVCSGYSIDGPVQQILDAGAHGFLQKPFSFNSISEILKEALEAD